MLNAGTGSDKPSIESNLDKVEKTNSESLIPTKTRSSSPQEKNVPSPSPGRQAIPNTEVDLQPTADRVLRDEEEDRNTETKSSSNRQGKIEDWDIKWFYSIWW